MVMNLASKGKYGTNGTEVTLDLDKLEETLGIAARHAADLVHEHLASLRTSLDNAYDAKQASDPDKNYRHLIYAKGTSEYLITNAAHLAACVQALYYVTEANKREEVDVAHGKFRYKPETAVNQNGVCRWCGRNDMPPNGNCTSDDCPSNHAGEEADNG